MSEYVGFDDETPARSVYDTILSKLIERWEDKARQLASSDDDLEAGIAAGLRHSAGELRDLLRVSQEDA